jgi:SMC interacting uncharacterized protein involved in chromosome segregation
MRGFGRTIPLEKFLREPMTKDFFDIFKFLISQLDPQLEFEGKMEDEIPLIMRRLRYPVEVNRSKLQSICGPNTWPQLLAVLDWLIALIEVNDALIQPIADCKLGLVDDDGEADHFMLETLHESYLQFLNGKDDHSVEERLRQVYEERLSGVQSEVDRLQDNLTGMDAQLCEFRSEHQRLLDTQAAPKQLEVEADRLRGTIQAQDARVQRMEEDTEAVEAEERTALAEIDDLQAQVRQLQEQVESQAYSKQDINRLKCERSHLRGVLKDLKTEAEKAEQSGWELGIEESRLQETISRTIRYINDKGEEGFKASDSMDEVDFEEPMKALDATLHSHQEAIQEEEAATHEVTEAQKAAQEELCEREKEVPRLRSRLEQVTRMREEYRVWSEGQLDDARGTAEEAEDAVQVASINTAAPTSRDLAEVDELKLRLSELSSQRKEARVAMEDRLRQEQNVREQHQQSVRKEMQLALDSMEQLREDVEQKLADLTEDGQAVDARHNPARGGS